MSGPDDLLEASQRLGDAVLDPAEWPNVMEGICRALNTTGAALLQGNVDAKHVPWTPSVDQMFMQYFRDNWHMRDVRAAKAVPRQLAGEMVLTEQDILSQDEIRSSPIHNETIFPSGFRWWAVVGFRAGSTLWGLSLQRTPREGPFGDDEKRALLQLSGRLAEAATLSKVIGQSVLAGTTNVLNLVGQPALAINGSGLVLDINAAAECLLGNDIQVVNRRLHIGDKRASAELYRLIEQLRVARDDRTLSTDLIVIRRAMKPPVVIRALPIEPAARSPFLGARALLTLLDLGEKKIANPALLTQAFGLTNAEARLAALVGAGEALEVAAEKLTISLLTARAQLKAIFAKTDTHRQSELVALVSRLRSFPRETEHG